jgi:hypothetical protein
VIEHEEGVAGLGRDVLGALEQQAQSALGAHPRGADALAGPRSGAAMAAEPDLGHPRGKWLYQGECWTPLGSG